MRCICHRDSDHSRYAARGMLVGTRDTWGCKGVHGMWFCESLCFQPSLAMRSITSVRRYGSQMTCCGMGGQMARTSETDAHTYVRTSHGFRRPKIRFQLCLLIHGTTNVGSRHTPQDFGNRRDDDHNRAFTIAKSEESNKERM